LSGKVDNHSSTLQPFITDDILQQGNQHIFCCKNSISLILVFSMHQSPDHHTLFCFLQLRSVDVAVAYVDTDREYGAEVKHTDLGYALRFRTVQSSLTSDQLLKYLERGRRVLSWLNDSE
jgi:hypothetical protein